MHWSDQGLISDVMVHVGSLAAIVAYFRHDVARLAIGGLKLARGEVTLEGKLALFIALATIPAVLFGIFVKKTGLIDAVRGPQIVAWNAIIFAVLMAFADKLGAMRKPMEQMSLPSALFIGIAQAIAIIPGTSRSGITITAARALGFTRPDAARFSFLLGIPALFGAGLLVIGDAVGSGESVGTDAMLAGGLAFFSALAAIAFLMAVLRRISLMPFVVYRLILGTVLLLLLRSG
jgi:undecaprenyl-diphosphatase